MIFDHEIALGSLMGLVMTFGSQNSNFLDGIEKWLIYGLEGCEENAPLDGKQELINAGRPKRVK